MKLIKNELYKAWFSYDAAHSDCNDFAKRTISDNILKDKAYKIFVNPKYDGYQRGLASMVYKLSDKKSRSGASVSEDLVQELHKPVIKKSKRNNVYARFKNNNLTADLTETGSLSFKNWGFKCLLCDIYIYIYIYIYQIC